MRIPFLSSTSGKPSVSISPEVEEVFKDIKETMRLRKKTATESALLKLKKELLKTSSHRVAFIYGSPNSAMDQFLTSYTKAYPTPTIAVSLFTLPYVLNLAMEEQCKIIMLPTNPITAEPDYTVAYKSATDSKLCIITDNLFGLRDSLPPLPADSKLKEYFVLNDLSESFQSLDDGKDIKNAFVFSIFSLGTHLLDGGGIVCQQNLSELPSEFKFIDDNVDYTNTDISTEEYSKYRESKLSSSKPTPVEKTAIWQIVDGLVNLKEVAKQRQSFAVTAKAWNSAFAGKPIVQPVVQRKITITANNCPTTYPIILPNKKIADKLLKTLEKLKIHSERLADRVPIDKSTQTSLEKKGIFDKTFRQSKLLAKRTIVLPLDSNDVTQDQIKAVEEALIKEFPPVKSGSVKNG